MGADLHIHAYSNGEVTEDDFKDFFSNMLGSKYFNPMRSASRGGSDVWMAAYTKLSSVPSVRVGEVSWLKAAVTGDSDSFIPAAIEGVQDAIGEDRPVIDDALIGKIEAAMNRKNDTQYQTIGKNEVVEFLRQNIGKRAFCVSW